MRQVKPEGPRIYKDKLYQDGAESIMVGSTSWQVWLAEEKAREFAFRAEDGSWHRARREMRRDNAYWYVACRVGGRVRRFYLGAAQTLDCTRLMSVAAAITAAREADSEG